MEEFDRLVRLNVGAVPLEAAVSDWALMFGEMLFLLIRKDGSQEYLSVPLDRCLLESIRESDRRGAFSLYRDVDGRLTPLGRHLASFFIKRHVPLRAVAHALGVSERMLRRFSMRPDID